MNQPIAILYFDPNAERSERTGAAIKSNRPDSYITIVHTVEAFRGALDHSRFDAILAGVENQEVASLVQEVCPEAPLLILTDEETTIQFAPGAPQPANRVVPVADSGEIVMALDHLVNSSRRRRRQHEILKEYQQKYPGEAGDGAATDSSGGEEKGKP